MLAHKELIPAHNLLIYSPSIQVIFSIVQPYSYLKGIAFSNMRENVIHCDSNQTVQQDCMISFPHSTFSNHLSACQETCQLQEAKGSQHRQGPKQPTDDRWNPFKSLALYKK